MTGLPGGVAIRRLGPEDAELFNRLSEADNLFDEDPSGAPSGALTPDGARAFLADPSVLFWVAESGPLTVGFLHCIVQRRRTAGPWAELLLMEMGVHTEWRRQGVGTALVSTMELWMAGNDVLEVWVPANTYAVGFYLKSGFTPDEGEILVKQLH
ncbi:GNAT family N-acetyltransferase [Arthrobacter sp. BE255]|uniref:GNAT family N-acetyltransferase n=1 Tax=Arthrobacter sp. BE255 TaxID=2817721 RepID=UPI0028618B0F|nr:GNAT family N-acetyltransferase [Arthrobacter sp. BE255]MDR7160896.1 GNAT superfamily N-acetyltransferase [Arthrobacter sp. BE255]